MLARLQKTTTLLLIAAALGWAVWSVAAGRPELAWLAALVIVGGYSGILLLEFLLLWSSYPASALDRPSAVQLISCWLKECAVAPRVFLWRQPFRSRRHADVLAAAEAGSRGVVLVHGFVCNRGLWNPWMSRLERSRIPFVAVNLEPVFGSIDGYARIVDDAVEALERATGLAPVLVAHSMGGLAVRAWIAQGNDRRFHRVVTVASPHQGTAIARRGFSENTRQMGVRSSWLAALRQREDPSLYRRFTCFWSHCDNIVFPTANATLPGADNRHLAATPHVQMAFHPEVIDEVLTLASAASLPLNRSSASIPRSEPGARSHPAKG